MRSIGLPELLVLLFVLAVPVGIGLLVVLMVRNKGAQNGPPADSAFPMNRVLYAVRQWTRSERSILRTLWRPAGLSSAICDTVLDKCQRANPAGSSSSWS